MTRKEKIESLKKIINDLETSMKRQPTTEDQFRDLDRKEKMLKETKRELRSLLYTDEEIKYQNRRNIINSNPEVIHQLEISTKYPPTNAEKASDYERKINLLNEYRKEMSDAMETIDSDYFIRPLKIIVEELDSDYCFASFVYGSDAQKRAVKQMFELRLIDEYGPNSEVQNDGKGYITTELKNENEVASVKIPKVVSFSVLNELISIPSARMQIGKKEMMFEVNYNERREELGMVNPLKANLEVYGKKEDGSIDWVISFVYDSKSQVDELYYNFEHRYIPDLGVHSLVNTEYGDFIKPSLAEKSFYGSKQIANVIVPDFLLHIMAKHLINDNKVSLNVGGQIFEGEYDNNSFIKSLDSLISDIPKL